MPALTAALLLVAAPAAAQGLRSLHVDALSMRADSTHLQVGQVFHLAVHVRVREQVAALDELVLPDVGTMRLEGDERHVTASPARTDVVETLTLEPTAAGSYTFNAAHLDAIDARTGKPSRFSSNPVRVVVAQSAFEYPTSPRALWPFLVAVLVAIVVVAAAVAAGLIALARRPRSPALPFPVAPAAPIVTPPAPPRTARDEVIDALRVYRTAPGHAALMRLRAALFAAAGAPPGATLRDALARTGDAPLRTALIAAERTAFGPAHTRDAASRELAGAAQAWLG